MKHHTRYLFAALVLIAIVIGVCALTPSAASEANVIYIADAATKGDGSGKDPSNPLRAEERVTRSAPSDSDAYKFYYAVGADGVTSDSSKRFYFNSVLYQASEKLAATGGKIVLVGDVVLDYSKTYSGSSKTDRDFYMYTHNDKRITITSQNDAKLVLTEGARLSLGGKTVFENITIATGATANSTTAGVQNRSISCAGYETVFGYGVKCINLDGNTASSYYPIITGGQRFGDFSGDTNVTIKSGTWGTVFGGNYGNSSNTHTGKINLTIENGEFLGSIVAGQRNAIHSGNSVLTITGGKFKGPIYAECSQGVAQASNTTLVNILNGDFSSASAIKKLSGTLADGKISPQLHINLAETKATDLEIGYLLNNTNADTISYPMSWCKNIEVITPPTSSVCLVGRDYDPSGLKIKLTYKNGNNTYESTVEYSKDNTNFEFDYNSSLIGIGEIVYKYAGKEYCTTDITVIENKVLYIANTAQGKGDGSSAANAMGAITVVQRDEALDHNSNDYKYYLGKKVDESGNVVNDSTKAFHKNGVLYQAYEKLQTTGGKIVLVGDVQLDFTTSMNHTSLQTRDVHLPNHSNYPIVITSQNGARLKVTDGVMLVLGGPTLFENMTFATGATELSVNGSQYNRAICADGNPVIFGNGLDCVNDDGETEAKAFIGINGGTRYMNLEKDTDVTVKAGKWAYLSGSSYGMDGYHHIGDIKMVIEGGTFLGNVSAVSRYEAMHVHYGNSTLIIKGGTFHNAIVGVGRMGTGYKNSRINIVVSGGDFVRTDGQYFSTRYAPHERATGINPYVTLDLTECTSISDFSKISTTFDKIYYPSSLCTGVSVNANATNTKCFVNEDYNASGLKVTATYKDSNNVTKTQSFTYDDLPHAFAFDFDNTKAGSAQMKWLVGNVHYKTSNIDIISIPAPDILGAQVRVKDSDNSTALRFVAEIKKPFGDGIAVKECGFVALNDFYLLDNSLLVVDGFYGPKDIKGTTFRADVGKIYNSDTKMTFSGEYPNLDVIDYDTDITVVAYVKFTYGGKTYIRYSDRITRNVVGVAEKALLSGIEKTESKDWMKSNLIDGFGAYTDSQLIDAAKANELRNEVINAYSATANYKWTPGSDFAITYPKTTWGITYNADNNYRTGTTYTGIPYVIGQKATVEEFTSYMQTYGGNNYYMGPIAGYKDVYKDIYNSAKYNEYLAYVDDNLVEIEGFFPGCDYSVVTNAWNKVTSNKVWTTTIQSFIPNQGRGTVTVGSYNCGTSADTKNIAQTLNGQSVMNAAYALCKPGDVLVSTTSADVYMVKSVAGASSVEVWKFSKELNSSSKSHFSTSSESFTTLYNNGFIPVTIPELATGVRSETTVVLSNFDGEKAVKDGIMNGVIESSRQIISVNVSILRNEKALYDKTVYYNSAADLNMNRVNLVEFNIANAVKFMVGGKSYVIRISAEVGGLSTEQSNIVLCEYSYTKPKVDSSKYYSFVDTFSGYDFSDVTKDMPQTAIDDMYKQYNSYYWSPEFDFKMGQLVVNGDEFVPQKVFYANNIYKGIVYADSRATLRDFQNYMSGMPLDNADTSAFGQNVYTFKLPSESKYTDSSTGEVRYDWTKFMGNHCSASMFHSYNLNSRIAAAGSRNNPDLVLVGFAEDIFYEYAGKNADTRTITGVYGKGAMYAAYAQAQKGDYMYTNRGGGHTRMVKEVHVEYNSNGTINGNTSWIRVVEQTDTPVLMKELKDNFDCDITDAEYNNPNAYSTWYMNKRYYFSDLYSTAVAIYRPTEYITMETEQPYVALKSSVSASMLSAKNTITGLVESNYPIISLKMEIKDSSGKAVATVYKRAMSVYSYNLKNLANSFETYPSEKGTYKFTLTAELAVGEAVLIRDFEFEK